MNDDAALLRRYATERSEEDFTELVRRHLHLVYFAALRRLGGDAPGAEDVTQQVFTVLARNASSLAQHAALTGWLHTTTRNLALKARRADQRRQVHEQEAQIMQELSLGSTPEADWERLRPVFDDTLDDLDDGDRQAILLRFFSGRPFREIGAALRGTDDAARMRVDRALDKLRALLVRRGITSTNAAWAVARANQAGVAAPAGLAASVAGAALTGAAAAGAGAALGTGFLAIMSTAKATGIASAIAVLAVGTAIFQANEARQAGTGLASANQRQDELRATVRELESRVAAEAKRAQAADDDIAKLLQALESVRASQAASTAESAGPITQDMVQARFRRAQELARNGNWEAALPEFLWCYDEGMVRISSFGPVRSSFLLGEIGRMAKVYPPAMAALRERRDHARSKCSATRMTGGRPWTWRR